MIWKLRSKKMHLYYSSLFLFYGFSWERLGIINVLWFTLTRLIFFKKLWLFLHHLWTENQELPNINKHSHGSVAGCLAIARLAGLLPRLVSKQNGGTWFKEAYCSSIPDLPLFSFALIRAGVMKIIKTLISSFPA